MCVYRGGSMVSSGQMIVFREHDQNVLVALFRCILIISGILEGHLWLACVWEV